MKKRSKDDVKKILVIRFRQIGDTILTTALCSTLKKNFPAAEVHIVLNERIAPVVGGHPDISKVITFSNDDNGNFLKYIARVWKVVHSEDYDIIVDIRSTVRTLFFSLFSLFKKHRPLRVGCDKKYARLFQHINIPSMPADCDVVSGDSRFATALSCITPIVPVKDFRLYVTDDEKEKFRQYMASKGIDFSRPVMLLGVTTKLAHKKWNVGYMKEVVGRLLTRYPQAQFIFNFAPGKEAAEAREMFESLGCPAAVKMDVEAKSLRELMALCSNCTFYFGNEGGARHLVQALGVPSYALFSPVAKKKRWLPRTSVPAYGIEPADVLLPGSTPPAGNMFDAVTPDIVCGQLFPLLDEIL